MANIYKIILDKKYLLIIKVKIIKTLKYIKNGGCK